MKPEWKLKDNVWRCRYRNLTVEVWKLTPYKWTIDAWIAGGSVNIDICRDYLSADSAKRAAIHWIDKIADTLQKEANK